MTTKVLSPSSTAITTLIPKKEIYMGRKGFFLKIIVISGWSPRVEVLAELVIWKEKTRDSNDLEQSIWVFKQLY